jgi:hypothetical protein
VYQWSPEFKKCFSKHGKRWWEHNYYVRLQLKKI